MRVDPLVQLGRLVEAARLRMVNPATRKPYQAAPAAKAAGVNRGTWGAIETGAHKAQDSTYAQVEKFFDWEEGSIKRYLEEEGPEPGPPLVVSDIGADPGRTLVVHYEGHELSDEDKARIEELARRLARGQ